MPSVKEMLKDCTKIVKPITEGNFYDEVVENSKKFPVAFPIDTVRCKKLKSYHRKEDLTFNISSTYPLWHEDVLKLACQFILFKKSNGTPKERVLYENMDIVSFVDRLLKKRSLTSFGPIEWRKSKNKNRGGWDKIGKDDEVPPLVLKDYLSHDEVRLSAMLYVSGHTVFINDGSRYNLGKPQKNNIEKYGVITGLIGTMLSKEGVLEWQDIIVDKKQNSEINGYGGTEVCGESITAARKYKQMWGDFYGLPRLTYDEAEDIFKKTDDPNMKSYEKYLLFDGEKYFDNKTYERHLSMPFDCILIEASARGVSAKKTSYLHLVGIGLGVWRKYAHQNHLFVKTFLNRVRRLIDVLPGLSDVHMSYLGDVHPDILTENGLFIECLKHPLGGIKINFSNREPSSKLVGEHEGKLLVETFAWDGNAQPGNEFWLGSLTGSGDPAAACSSQIAELHNSHINTRFVSGNNLHVAGKYGLLHISQYSKKILEE